MTPYTDLCMLECAEANIRTLPGGGSMAVAIEPIMPRGDRWEEFLDRLCGPAYCNWKEESWTCHGDLRFTRALLVEMGLSTPAINVSLQYFQDHGGYCDCEVVLNVR